MQKLFELSKWERVEAGEVVTFPGENVRRVRLEVSAPLRAIMTLVSAGRTVETVVAGRDVIELTAEGPLEVSASEGLYWYSADGKDWSVAPVDDTTFTQIVERRVRNPEMEYMMYLQQVNMEKRLASQAADYERLLKASTDRRDAELERRRLADEARSKRAEEAVAASGDGGGATEPPSGGGTSAEGASKSPRKGGGADG